MTQGEARCRMRRRARPYASGQLNLSIPPLQRTLAVEVNPDQAELEPGGETTLDLLVKDAGGQPVADAELAVVVVDEAMLALTNYQLADPLEHLLHRPRRRSAERLRRAPASCWPTRRRWRNGAAPGAQRAQARETGRCEAPMAAMRRG